MCLHQPWGMLKLIVNGEHFYASPAKRFKSTWISIVLHFAQSVLFAFLVLGIVLGLA